MAIDVDGKGVVIREIVRTRRVTWSTVSDVFTAQVRWSPVIEPDYPCFSLDDGSVVKAKEIRGPVVQDVVAEARRRLTMHGE